jgi:FAM192A/Fyv6, N-terminal domain
MSSGFVPAGSSSTDQPADDWHKAQQAIQASRQQKLDEGRQENGKTLYEVLQQNKSKPARPCHQPYHGCSAELKFD